MKSLLRRPCLLCILFACRIFSAHSQSAPLSFVKPADASFQILLEEYYPGLSALPDYEKMKPYLVLLQNDTGQRIVAYSVVWLISFDGGRGRYLSTSYVGTRRPVNGINQSIPPNGIRLVSAVFDLSPEQYRDSHDFIHFYPSDAFPAYPRPHTVDASLDAYVEINGAAFGPHKTTMMERLTAARDAEHDEVLTLLDALHDNQLFTWGDLLQQHVTKGFSAQGNDEKAMYWHARAATADSLMTLSHHVPRSQFISELNRLSAAGRFNGYSRMHSWF